ncbi:MAG: MFS transporter [Candidatus Sphingomonas colombiensis]|nr:MFS transporter [Sphingomonas sp.]WEK42055.1 MAG: MFS transporter [Sphingomonas sp.]
MTRAVNPRLSNKWLVLFLLLGVGLFNQGDRFLLAGLVEPIKAEFGVSDGFMGLLMGPAFALLYSLLAIPIARAADRMSRILIIVVGCLVWSGFTAASGLAQGPWTLAGARVGVGVGEAAFQAPAYALIAAYFVPEQRGRAFAIMGLNTYIGQTLGYVVGPALAADATWRYPFAVMGGCGFAIGLIALVLIREPKRLVLHTELKAPNLSLLARQLAGIVSYRNMMLGMALGVLSGISFGLWGPALFARAYALPIKQASTLFGLAFGIAGLVGMLFFGVLADRASKRDPGAPLRLAAIALAAATALIMIVTWTPTLGVARWLAVPCGLLGGGWSVGVVVALQHLLPDRIRATGTALGMLVVNLLGAVGGPWLAGALSGAVGGDATHSLRIGLSAVIPLGFLGAWLIWRARGSLIGDRETLAKLDG